MITIIHLKSLINKNLNSLYLSPNNKNLSSIKITKIMINPPSISLYLTFLKFKRNSILILKITPNLLIFIKLKYN
jgi:hypothetical protein